MNWSETFSNPAVIWFIIGLVLALLEFGIPGLIILFFGIGAWVTAICYLLFEPGINIQLVIFIVSSVLSIFLLRRSLKKKFFGEDANKEETLSDEFIGQTAEVETEITKDKPGKVIFKGAKWQATADEKIKSGTLVEIVGKESIRLIVAAKN